MTDPAQRMSIIGDEAGDTVEEQIAAVQFLGLQGLELRGVDGHLLAELKPAEFADLAEEWRTTPALTIVAVDTPLGAWQTTVSADLNQDLRTLHTYAERAAAVGCSSLRIMSYPNAHPPLPLDEWREESLRHVMSLAREASSLGVTLLHENCAGWAGRNAVSTIEMLDYVDNPSLRLLFDTGNGPEYGYDGLDFLRQIAGAVSHVHVKDAVFAEGGVRYMDAGTGGCQVAEMTRVLEASGYQGFYSLEPHIAVAPHEGRTSSSGERIGVAVAATSAARQILKLAT